MLKLASPVQRIHLKLITAAAFWAMTPIFGRLLADYRAPYALACGRFIFATLALAAILAFRPARERWIAWRDLPIFILLGFTGVCLHNVLVLMGVQYTQANRANVIFASISLLIVLLDLLFLRRLPRLLTAGGLLIGIAGTALVVTDGDLAQLATGGIGRGEWLVLGSAASWALYSVLGRGVLQRYAPLTIVFYASVCGTLMLLPLVWLDVLALPQLLRDPHAWLMVGFVGCLNSALGFLWYYQAVQALGALTSSAYINLVPIFGVVFSALLLDETPSSALLIGGALVIASLMVLARSPSD
jgi:drug/metabolite transporter (DMT)-like permease